MARHAVISVSPSDKCCEAVFIADTEPLNRCLSLTANASTTSILFSISSCKSIDSISVPKSIAHQIVQVKKYENTHNNKESRYTMLLR